MRRLALVLVVAALTAGCGGKSAPKLLGVEIQGSPPSPDFALHDQDGRLVKLSALRGDFVLITFLYTHCPDTCPLIATRLDTALRRLGAARDGVRALAVSVDPKGDTRAAARAFVRKHALVPQFRYLIGTHAQLAPVWRAYHIAVVPGQPEQTVGHSAFILLVDRDGKQRVLYDAQAKPDVVLHDLRALGGY